ncbi:MAG: hypothetical protein GEV09_13720 [Pseudonocardiaceae bacterium]|nr:hypothetical protein [Pseudonocardiaceae bacterium]
MVCMTADGQPQRRAAVALVAALGLLAGCASSPSAGGGTRPIELVELEAPLTHAAWATEVDALLGLTAEDRLLEIDPDTGETAYSLQLKSTGENLAVVTRPSEHVYVPQPDFDRIAVIGTKSLERIRDLGAGQTPHWVASHPTSFTLLAISEDGSTVTGVDTETHEVSFRQQVAGGPAAVVAEAGDSLDPAFWLVGPGRVAHFAGKQPTPTADRTGELSHETFSPDRDTPEAAYLTEEGSSRVVALEGQQGELAGVAEQDLGEPVEHVESKAKEEFRVYAATASSLTVLRSDNLERLDTIEFRSVLDQAGLGGARIGGLTVGDSHIYLGVEGEPYVLRIRKPAE